MPDSPAPAQTVASRQPRPAAPLPLGSHTRIASNGSWTAQLGLFARQSKARIEAMAAQKLGGAGIPRIARVERHGKTLWNAQLAGLSLSAAHQTCDALAARGSACRILAPSADHLAMETSPTRDPG
jgi:hypothetical protein